MLSKSRRRKVEHAARLAMPAVTPAEPHAPDLYGGINAIRPARLRAPPPAAPPKWSKPPGLPCRRSRRQSDTILNSTGVPTPSGPHDCALHLNPPPLSPSPYPPCSPWFAFSVSSVQLARRFFSAREDFLCRNRSELPARPQPPRLFGCGPAALWFAFSASSPPPVTTFPKSFSLPFQPLPNSPFLLLLLLSCMLKVKGAADALVGARTADGASPGQQRRRLQPLPSPDGGELRSLKPAAGGEQAGGGLLT